MFQGAKVPGNESSWERKFQGAKVPCNFRSRERKYQGAKVPPMVLSLPRAKVCLGAKVRGNESSSERKFQLPKKNLISDIADTATDTPSVMADLENIV